MEDHEPVRLASLTTLRVGGPCLGFVEASSEAELVDVVAALDEAGEPLLIVGGGSNLVVADAGFPGTVVRIATRGIDVPEGTGEHVDVSLAAGEPWEPFVERAVDEGWSGVEAMSGIPGLAGATPVQNVGAYGQELADVLVSVRVYDRAERAVVELRATDCGFGYRTSRFKRDERWVVLSATLRLQRSNLAPPLAYAELARTLGSQLGRRVPTGAVRAAVLGLRRGKGMVEDPSDLDTASVGSFFTNPIVSANVADLLPPTAPRFSQPDGRVKLSAAWLIEQAGFAREHGHGDARVSSKHTLALTNRGSATTEQLLDLAREIRDEVRRVFGVELIPEPRLVGCAL